MKKITYIDLGLPSGTLWASSNSEICGKRHFTYDEAMKNFDEQMPTAEQFQELVDNCKWHWIELFGGRIKGYRITGPNRSSIFLPASGYYNGTSLSNRRSIGYYWSTRFYDSSYAWNLYFNSSDHYVGLSGRGYGFSVRTVINSNGNIR
jgi:hypothetical protein